MPPNNGSPAISAAVKQVTAKSGAKGTKAAKETAAKSEKPVSGESSSSKKQNAHAEDNWTSSLPSVPGLHHMSPPGELEQPHIRLQHILTVADIHVANLFALHRPLSVVNSIPKETEMKEFEKIFKARSAKSRSQAKQTEVIHTLSSALRNLNEQMADKQKHHLDESSSPQKEVFRVVDGAGNQFKIVKGKDGAATASAAAGAEQWRPFVPPPPPMPVSAEQLKALDRRQAAGEEDGEESLHSELEAQILSQDAEAAAARGRRDRQKLDALLTPRQKTQTAEIVLNSAALREKFSFFTPSEPAAVQEPSPRIRVGRRRRGVAIVNPKKSNLVYRMISVKRQRKLKMKKHKVCFFS